MRSRVTPGWSWTIARRRADQTVEQGRLADVRPPHDRHRGRQCHGQSSLERLEDPGQDPPAPAVAGEAVEQLVLLPGGLARGPPPSRPRPPAGRQTSVVVAVAEVRLNSTESTRRLTGSASSLRPPSASSAICRWTRAISRSVATSRSAFGAPRLVGRAHSPTVVGEQALDLGTILLATRGRGSAGAAEQEQQTQGNRDSRHVGQCSRGLARARRHALAVDTAARADCRMRAARKWRNW